jgi:hypothetical protein
MLELLKVDFWQKIYNFVTNQSNYITDIVVYNLSVLS